MNRRHFLSLLGLGSAGLVLDPERLLWVPGQKTIFLPPAQGYRNTVITGQMIAAEWERVVRAQTDPFHARSYFEDSWRVHATIAPTPLAIPLTFA